MTGLVRGRLLDADAVPATGERFEPLVESGALRIEQILSGAAVAPTEYVQDHDEWVVVLTGAADLLVGDTPVTLGPGEWVWLPAQVPHTVAAVEPGTRWLAVHHQPG